MTKCKRRVIAAMIIIAAGALCLTGVIFLLRIDQPVFFYTYGSYPMTEDPGNSGQEHVTFYLNYITNIEDPCQVVGIDFPEAAEKSLSFSVFEGHEPMLSDTSFSLLNDGTQNPDVVKVGRYAVHTVTVIVSADDSASDEETVLHNAVVAFSNHKTQTISMGTIELYRSSLKDDNLSWSSSTGSVDGVSDSTLTVHDPITILSVQPQCVQFPDSIQYTINDVSYKDIAGTACEKGDVLKLHSAINLSNDVVIRENNYNIRMLMRYRDERGQEHLSLIDILSHSPAHDHFWNLVSYLKARKAL